jgi:hypothetical protein
MLEYTHLKVDGSCELVASGHALACVVDDPRHGFAGPQPVAADGSAHADRDLCGAVARSAVDGALTLTRALLRLLFGVFCAVFGEIVVPAAREIGCILGVLLCYATGGGLRAGETLHGHSQVLSAGNRLLCARRAALARTEED